MVSNSAKVAYRDSSYLNIHETDDLDEMLIKD